MDAHPVSQPAPAGLAHLSCDVCTKTYPRSDIFKAQCIHKYCKTCITRLVKQAIEVEMDFPVRCCRRQIRLPTAMLDQELLSQYDQKKIEYMTVNRTYCCKQSCHTFIPPCNITEGAGSCPICNHKTCTACKADAHYKDCRSNPQYQLFLQTAQNRGWKQCYACNRMVELTRGCNHIV